MRLPEATEVIHYFLDFENSSYVNKSRLLDFIYFAS